MCGGTEEFTLQQRQEEIKTEIQQQSPEQQTWVLTEGQILEQPRTLEAEGLITRQQEINVRLAAQAQEQLPLIQAKTAAAGTPEQTVSVTKKSWKQRREDEKRSKEAKKHTHALANADHVTYTVHRDLVQYRQFSGDNAPSNRIQRYRPQSAAPLPFRTPDGQKRPAPE